MSHLFATEHLSCVAFFYAMEVIFMENEVLQAIKTRRTLLRKWGLPETLRGVGALAFGYSNPTVKLPATVARKSDYIVKI